MSLTKIGSVLHRVRLRASRGAAVRILGAVLLAGGAFSLTACEERSPMDEFVEEVEDEAKDAKEAVEDEIDDHS